MLKIIGRVHAFAFSIKTVRNMLKTDHLKNLDPQKNLWLVRHTINQEQNMLYPDDILRSSALTVAIEGMCIPMDLE